jgi:hypothetical protein
MGMCVNLVGLCTQYIMDGGVHAEGHFQVCVREEVGDLIKGIWYVKVDPCSVDGGLVVDFMWCG